MIMMKNSRFAYGDALYELAQKDERIVALEADVGNSTRTLLLGEHMPHRHFDMGIAEQNMASTAAGFALGGHIPFINSFAVFVAGRGFDQIRQSIAVPRLNVKICGTSAGLSSFGDGASHQAIEDVAIMRALPNMTVLVAADAVETKKMVKAMVDFDGPVYLRLNRNDVPVVTREEDPFEIGKPSVLREGKDVAILAMGIMVSRALEAAQALKAEGIEARVVNVSTIKPLSKEKLMECLKGVKGIVTAEEHNIVGGLGGAVAEVLRSECIPMEFVGVEDVFGESSHDYDLLLDRYGLNADAVAAAARRIMAL